MSQNLMPSMISIDPNINRIILEAIADDDTRNIINTTLTEPKIIFDILKSCKIPQTSGYRKINNLIKNRLLMIAGYERTDDGKIISKYQSVFENIRVHIEKNKVTVHVSPTKKALDKGVICPVIQGNEILLSWNQE